MRRIAIPGATVVLVGSVVAPAPATVSLNEACAATLAALGSNGGTSGATVFAGSRFTSGSRITDAQAGTFGMIAGEGLSAKDRKEALGYLGKPTATAWLNSDSFYGTSWVDSYEAALAQVAGLPADCAAAAGGLLSQSGVTYTYANVSIDIESGAVTRWGTTSFTFGAQNLPLPQGTPVAYTSWLKASQAASLNATLRAITRTVAQTVPEPTKEAIDALLRTSVDPARAVPLRIRQLRAGSLLSGRNPFTKTYHAWRVYLKDGQPVARKVAP
jgi:hypothetical protein